MSRKIWLIIILGIFLLICVPVLIILFFWNVGGTQNGANSGKFSSTMPGIISPETYPSQLSFVSFMDDDLALYTVNTDGAQLTRLTQEKMLVMNPVWSPDGSRIAFEACLGGSMSTDCPAGVSFDIFVINIDGSDLKNITNDPSSDRFPSWSPDGRWIAYQSNQDSEISIYILCADCSSAPKTSKLTSSEVNANQPAWSPNGAQIAYLSDGDLYVMNIDGSEHKQLASNILGAPIWQP